MILETGNWKLETGNWKLETGYWKLETGYWLLVTGFQSLISNFRSRISHFLTPISYLLTPNSYLLTPNSYLLSPISYFLLVVLSALSVYLLTLAPSLTWAHWGTDGGDFVTAAVTGRTPHPPGFPVYMTLARLFVRLPWGDPAWRLNLLSAVMAAGAAGLVALTLRRWRVSPWAAIPAALSLAFAPLFWSQALITEVYTTAAFFVALAVWWQSQGESFTQRREGAKLFRWASLYYFVIGLVWGLGCAVHPTVGFLAPLILANLFKSKLPLSPSPPLPLLFLGFAAGLLPYALLPLSGSWPQPWGDLRTPAGWWEFVGGRMYWGYAFALPLGDWPRRVLAWAALLARQFTPVGALLASGGTLWLWRRHRWAAAGLLGALGVLSVYAMGYNTPDSLVYLTSGLPLLALLVGLGLEAVIRRGLPRWLGFGLPLALLLWHWGSLDLHADRAADVWLDATLAQAPPDAVLLVKGDQETFTLWYAQAGRGLRPDVWVVNEALWEWESYRAFLKAQTGIDAAQRPEDFAQGRPRCALVDEEVVCY